MAFVKERKQFGRPIAEFQGLQWMLADMAVALNAARLSLHQAALSADPFPDPLLAAQAKIIASETANTVTNQALQLFGARGYSRTPPRTDGSGCPHVHDCRRHGAGAEDTGGVQDSRHKDPADPQRIPGGVSSAVPRSDLTS